MSGTSDDLEAFDCPRCGGAVEERFWGPCRSCRQALVAAHQASPAGADGGRIGAARFEPAMHVVPNHVATKD